MYTDCLFREIEAIIKYYVNKNTVKRRNFDLYNTLTNYYSSCLVKTANCKSFKQVNQTPSTSLCAYVLMSYPAALGEPAQLVSLTTPILIIIIINFKVGFY
jgi:hypothetical protein